MLCRGAKQDFWQNKVRPGDKFILRNEFERVDHTIALLKSALEGAVRLEHAASRADGDTTDSTGDNGDTWHSRGGESKDGNPARSRKATGMGMVQQILTSDGPGKQIKTTAFALRERLLCFQPRACDFLGRPDL